MTDFKAKMHQIRFWLGLRPRSRWGAYSAPPDPLARFRGWGRFAAGGGVWAGEEEGKWKRREGEREGPKLLLNHGPSDPCYATVHDGGGAKTEILGEIRHNTAPSTRTA